VKEKRRCEEEQTYWSCLNYNERLIFNCNLMQHAALFILAPIFLLCIFFTRAIFANSISFRFCRWLTHKGSGEFKGCGYVQFYDSETTHAAAQLNGSVIMGRPVRLDWAE